MQSTNFGVVRVGIGKTLYNLSEPDGRTPMLTRTELGSDTPDDFTRIMCGKLGSIPTMSVVANPDDSFSFDDPQRINAAAALASNLLGEVVAIGSREESQRLINSFAAQMRSIGKGVSQTILDEIAIMEETLRREKYAAPERLRNYAKKMRELKIAGVRSGFPQPVDKEIDTQQYSPKKIDQEAEKIEETLAGEKERNSRIRG